MYVKACVCMPVCLIGSDTIGFVGGRYSVILSLCFLIVSI